MKEKPILFSGPMVRAILEGRKTQTRRVIKNFPDCFENPVVERFKFTVGDFTLGYYCYDSEYPEDGAIRLNCPYPPDTRLWVRETWRVGAWNEENYQIAVDYKADNYERQEWLHVEDEELFERLWIESTDDAEKAGIKLNEDDRYEWDPGESPCRWRPSIFMPRWASRIDLEVTAVRAERVNQISNDDILREGIRSESCNICPHEGGSGCKQCMEIARPFITLWDSINGKKHPWNDNPWVWVYEFKRIKP